MSKLCNHCEATTVQGTRIHERGCQNEVDTIVLADDGTMDTVFQCTACGEQIRYTYDPSEDFPESEAEARYDAFVYESLRETQDEHECPEDDDEDEDEDEDSESLVVIAEWQGRGEPKMGHFSYDVTIINEEREHCTQNGVGQSDIDRILRELGQTDTVIITPFTSPVDRDTRTPLRKLLEELSAMALQMEDLCSDLSVIDPDDVVSEVKVDIEALVAKIQELL